MRNLNSTRLALVVLAAATTVPAQSGGAPAFEVASVKPAAPCCAAGQWRESKAGDDRIDFRYVTLRYCVAFAYGLKEYQVSGPAWIGETRYDIVAKGPAGTRHDQLPAMVKTMLTERFGLESHLEKKEFGVFALVAGKNGVKLQESPADANAPPGASFGISMNGAVGRLEAKRADMKALANTLPRFVGRPVVNLTGLEARYDFELEFSPDDAKGMALQGPSDGSALPTAELGASIFTSIQRLGLKLEPRKLPLDAVVVDSAVKTPIEN